MAAQLEQELRLLTEVVGTGQRICLKDETTRLAAAAVRAAVLRIAVSMIARSEAALGNLRRELELELEPDQVQALLDQHCMLNLTRGCVMACQAVMQMQFEILDESDDGQQCRRLAKELGAVSEQLGILAAEVAIQIDQQRLSVDGERGLDAAKALMNTAAKQVSSLAERLRAKDVNAHVPAVKTYQSIHGILKATAGHGAD
jgi:hypothetical protein